MNTQSQPERRSPLIWGWLMLVMLVAGAAIPAQGRVNAELARDTADPLFAALSSFFIGLLIMIPAALGTRRGRAGMRRVLPSIRAGKVTYWHLLTGFIGGYFVLTQGLAMAAVGAAVFSVAVVTGQTVGGLLWDRIGLGPLGRKRLSGLRVLGALLTVVSVLWAVSPQLTAEERGWAWLLLVLLPFSGGFGQAAQQALNGKQTAAYGNPLPATLFNFASGTAILLVAWCVKLLVTGFGESLPMTWWYYLGGPFGIVFIALGAYLVTRVGVLLTAMGMIAGQLLGSLVLDLLFPTPGAVVTWGTILGTALTLLAVMVASIPDLRRPRP